MSGISAPSARAYVTDGTFSSVQVEALYNPDPLCLSSPISQAAPSLEGRVTAGAPSSEALVASVFSHLKPISFAYVRAVGEKIEELRKGLSQQGGPLTDAIQQQIAEHQNEITRLKIKGLAERVTPELIETQVKEYLAILSVDDLKILLEYLESPDGKLAVQIYTGNLIGGAGLCNSGSGSVLMKAPAPVLKVCAKIGYHFHTRPAFLKEAEKFLGYTNLSTKLHEPSEGL
jgi:hypothetical protein